jgi:tetratricopeptide (TPR) repeat protein
MLKDPARLSQCIKLDPKGRYSTYACFHRAAILSDATDAIDRREAVASLLSIAFGGESEFAEDALYLAAVKCYGEKRYSESSSLFHRYMKRFAKGKRYADVRSMCAWSDYLSGRYADAIALCGDGDSDDFAYVKAACAYACGDTANAARLFAEYLENYPNGRNRLNAELPLARMEFDKAEKSGDVAKAMESAKRAYSLSKNSGDALRLAWAYEKAGLSAEALHQYDAIVKADSKSPEAAEALYRRAMSELRAGRWAAADVALAEALSSNQLGQRRGLALYWRGVAALRLEHEEEGAGFLTQALELSLPLDESREAKLMLADINLRSGRISEAKAAYEKLVLDGACERMSAAKILTVGKLVSPQGAKICAQALIRSDSSQWRQAGYSLLGVTEENAGSFTAAIAAYRSAMAQDAKTEDIAASSLRLGLLEMRTEQYEAAEKTLKRSIELNSSNARARAEAYVALARASLAKGDRRAARGYATVVTALFDDPTLCDEAKKILERTK